MSQHDPSQHNKQQEHHEDRDEEESQIRGILKKPKQNAVPPTNGGNNMTTLTPTQTEHVVWDEANLEKNEAERVPCMKIDEPPTPFHQGQSPVLTSMDDQFDLDNFSLNPAGHKQEQEIVIQNTLFNTTTLDNRELTSEESSDEEDDPYYGMTEEEKQEKIEKARKFKEMRKSHYDKVGMLIGRRGVNPLANQRDIDSSEDDATQSDYQEDE